MAYPTVNSTVINNDLKILKDLLFKPWMIVFSKTLPQAKIRVGYN